MELISQGAEAKIYDNGDTILKYRFSKSYRIKEIDEIIIKRRTRGEKKIIQRLLENGIKVPRLKELEKNVGENFTPQNTICMEKLNGILLQNYLNDENSEKIVFELGKLVRTIHDLNIIHGDITTANFFVVDNELFVIDFGLSFHSMKDEDKAVDLYVFEKGFKCVHDEKYLKFFFEGYGESFVLSKLEAARKRGRKLEECALG